MRRAGFLLALVMLLVLAAVVAVQSPAAKQPSVDRDRDAGGSGSAPAPVCPSGRADASAPERVEVPATTVPKIDPASTSRVLDFLHLCPVPLFGTQELADPGLAGVHLEGILAAAQT